MHIMMHLFLIHGLYDLILVVSGLKFSLTSFDVSVGESTEIIIFKPLPCIFQAFRVHLQQEYFACLPSSIETRWKRQMVLKRSQQRSGVHPLWRRWTRMNPRRCHKTTKQRTIANPPPSTWKQITRHQQRWKQVSVQWW